VHVHTVYIDVAMGVVIIYITLNTVKALMPLPAISASGLLDSLMHNELYHRLNLVPTHLMSISIQYKNLACLVRL